MLKRLVFVFALAPIAACGSKASSTADTTPKTSEVVQPSAPATSGTILEIGEITVSQGDTAVLRVHANG